MFKKLYVSKFLDNNMFENKNVRETKLTYLPKTYKVMSEKLYTDITENLDN